MNWFRLNELGCPAFDEKEILGEMSSTRIEESQAHEGIATKSNVFWRDTHNKFKSLTAQPSNINYPDSVMCDIFLENSTSQGAALRVLTPDLCEQPSIAGLTPFSRLSSFSSDVPCHTKASWCTLSAPALCNSSAQLCALRHEIHPFTSDFCTGPNNAYYSKTPLMLCKRYSLTSVPTKKARTSIIP